MPTNETKMLLVIGASLALRAKRKAKKLGVSRSQYIRDLIDNDTRKKPRGQ